MPVHTHTHTQASSVSRQGSVPGVPALPTHPSRPTLCPSWPSCISPPLPGPCLPAQPSWITWDGCLGEGSALGPAFSSPLPLNLEPEQGPFLVPHARADPVGELCSYLDSSPQFTGPQNTPLGRAFLDWGHSWQRGAGNGWSRLVATSLTSTSPRPGQGVHVVGPALTRTAERALPSLSLITANPPPTPDPPTSSGAGLKTQACCLGANLPAEWGRGRLEQGPSLGDSLTDPGIASPVQWSDTTTSLHSWRVNPKTPAGARSQDTPHGRVSANSSPLPSLILRIAPSRAVARNAGTQCLIPHSANRCSPLDRNCCLERLSFQLDKQRQNLAAHPACRRETASCPAPGLRLHQ